MLKYDVEFPSGRKFSLTGNFQVVAMPPDMKTYPVIDQGKLSAIYILDRRATVKCEGRVVYDGPDEI